MPVNVLRKKGARMSLQEALDRIEKLKRLAQSSNPHEAALASLRLKTFNVNAARAPKGETVQDHDTKQAENSLPDNVVEVLDEFPAEPHREIGEIEVRQSPEKSTVNWDALHFELIEKAQKNGADAIVNIQLKGTADQKILSATALQFLNPLEILELERGKKVEEDEKVISMAAKERRDEDTAPGIG